MRWFLIPKEIAANPKGSSYTRWKPILAKDGNYQCVYCCINDAQFGGTRNFHVEHYRPKSKWPSLADDYRNLYYSCGICNIFKSDHFPNESALGRIEVAHYPDPSITDYGKLFSVDVDSSRVSGVCVAGKFLVESLHLNRPQILVLRRVIRLQVDLAAARELLLKLSKEDAVTKDDLQKIVACLAELGELLQRMLNARPYDEAGLK